MEAFTAWITVRVPQVFTCPSTRRLVPTKYVQPFVCLLYDKAVVKFFNKNS